MFLWLSFGGGVERRRCGVKMLTMRTSTCKLDLERESDEGEGAKVNGDRSPGDPFRGKGICFLPHDFQDKKIELFYFSFLWLSTIWSLIFVKVWKFYSHLHFYIIDIFCISLFWKIFLQLTLARERRGCGAPPPLVSLTASFDKTSGVP